MVDGKGFLDLVDNLKFRINNLDNIYDKNSGPLINDVKLAEELNVIDSLMDELKGIDFSEKENILSTFENMIYEKSRNIRDRIKKQRDMISKWKKDNPDKYKKIKDEF